MSRQLLVVGQKTFKITIPDGAKVTFGPWSPAAAGEAKYGGSSDRALNGTLRVYADKTSGATILAVFSGVTAFRELSMDYEEEVAREEGAIVWKSDKEGYKREEKVSRSSAWGDPVKEIGSGEPEDNPHDL